ISPVIEGDSISIIAKDEVTLEVARNVAKHSKTLANLIASTDEMRQKEPIRLPQFEASTLDKVFEWCEEHSGVDPAHADFSMPATFSNEYPRYTLTTWQTSFFHRHDAHKWELAVAASYLDIPYLYFSACFLISESLRMRSDEWDEAVPESVSDDVLCDVLRFLSYKDVHARGHLKPRWKRVIKENARRVPLKTVMRADIEGDKVKVSTKKVLDDLESLCCYAVEKLSIDRFGKKECAVIQAFLDESSTRLRVKSLDVGESPRKSRKTLRTRMRTLKELTERLNFLEDVRLDLSCDMQVECLVDEP
ncbi:Protein SKR-5, partial [Aphelenchoides avenae]